MRNQPESKKDNVSDTCLMPEFTQVYKGMQCMCIRTGGECIHTEARQHTLSSSIKQILDIPDFFYFDGQSYIKVHICTGDEMQARQDKRGMQ
jgi:hypothetical protein